MQLGIQGTEEQTMRVEVERRRTFAVISHPDAGKTTLTEKLLLYGGAIRLAGSVKARKAERHAVSDWMDIEKQRGISVTTSAMAFDYKGCRVNILDTPGHQDFSEDTYRTLMAADSAVMLIDAAKGVEEQTVKLFQVCRRRGIPIFTFVNKMDRASRDPFELMEEIERVLGIRACPVSWPIGVDGDFQGVYLRDEDAIERYTGSDHGAQRAETEKLSLAEAEGVLEGHYISRLREEIELLEGAGDAFDIGRVRAGELTPMMFGSAMNNFGIEPFLARFLSWTMPPQGREAIGYGEAEEAVVPPESAVFSGFIFKIQANMNPAHRDRIAFMRVCSGRFERGMEVWHSGTNKHVKLAQPQQFFADERAIIETAYPGDIIGLFDPGMFGLGDTLCGEGAFRYHGIPVFAPEHFSRVSAMDSMKRKQFVKGMEQLSQEGAVQTFHLPGGGSWEAIAGVVGVLQLEVLTHRLKGEYSVEPRIETLPYRYVRWVSGRELDGLKLTSTTLRAFDRHERPVLMFENAWSMNTALENNPGLALADMAPGMA